MLITILKSCALGMGVFVVCAAVILGWAMAATRKPAGRPCTGGPAGAVGVLAAVALTWSLGLAGVVSAGAFIGQLLFGSLPAGLAWPGGLALAFLGGPFALKVVWDVLARRRFSRLLLEIEAQEADISQ